jgi:hypothetical protein
MKNLIGYLFAVAMLTATLNAAQLSMSWRPSPSPAGIGYRIYFGTAGSRQYSQSVDVGNVTSYVLTGLADGQIYYLAATCYDAERSESPYSVEVEATTGYDNSFDNSYQASGLTLDPNQGTISGNILNLPADPKLVYWSKGGLCVESGQILILGGNMYYSGAASVSPVSVYLVDESTGKWLSPERVMFIDSSYGCYQAELTIFGCSNNAKLYVACGHATGLYQFQQLDFWLTGVGNQPVYDLYLRQLLPKQSVGLFSAEWFWQPVPASEGYVVRAATTRNDIERGSAGNLLTTQVLLPGQTSFRRDVDTAAYSGIYLAVTSLYGGQESIPWITWYLPGDILNTADDDIPPLCFRGSVDLQDANYASAGYSTLKTVPALAPGLPAGPEERTDIDNNGYAGRVSDYSFIRSQYLNGRRMK